MKLLLHTLIWTIRPNVQYTFKNPKGQRKRIGMEAQNRWAVWAAGNNLDLNHLFYLIVTDPLPPFLIDTDALFWLFVDLPSAQSLTWRAEKSGNHHFKSKLHDCAQFLGKDKKGGQKGDSYGKASLSKLPLWLGGLEQSKLLISWWLKASLQRYYNFYQPIRGEDEGAMNWQDSSVWNHLELMW